ncbi:MAG TPA: histidine phosphatase family protein [Dehalococcoidia bacterium]|nr:histidine phosphatase family protein [Dehalococcoidia bacterium]
MRLVLLRHGETEHNRDGLTLGRYDAPLTERGRAQARAVATSFTTPPDALYSSPLARAAETAAAIAAHTAVAVTVAVDLTEMDVGEMEHLSGAALRERYPDFLRAWLSPHAADARMPGGETLREVQQRAWDAVQRWRAASPEACVAAVTHNFVILALICRAIDLPLADFRRLRHGLAARTLLDIHEDGGTLLLLNDQSHLVAAGLGDDPVHREAPR